MTYGLTRLVMMAVFISISAGVLQGETDSSVVPGLPSTVPTISSTDVDSEAKSEVFGINDETLPDIAGDLSLTITGTSCFQGTCWDIGPWEAVYHLTQSGETFRGTVNFEDGSSSVYEGRFINDTEVDGQWRIPTTPPGEECDFASGNDAQGTFTGRIDNGRMDLLLDGIWPHYNQQSCAFAGNGSFTGNVVSGPSSGQPPEITLLGPDPLNHVQGCPFVGAGATAIDAEDGDLTDSIIITGTENLDSPGLQTITYSVTDSSGLSAVVTRQVVVFGVVGTPGCFVGSPAGRAAYLVVLVHGCCTDANGVKEWDDLGKLIAGTIQIPAPEQWEIVVWDWHTHTPNTGRDQVGRAYNNAEGQGNMLGMKIAEHPYTYVHLIGHSAGARLIWLAAIRLAQEKVSNNQREEWPFIHLTFLDAYTPNYGLGGDDYGNLYEYPKDKRYAEHYVDRTQSSIIGPLTNTCLASAFNFNITDWPALSEEDRLWKERDAGHQWPRRWYRNSVTFTSNMDTPPKPGFNLSFEGGNNQFQELEEKHPPGHQCPLLDEETECQPEVCWRFPF